GRGPDDDQQALRIVLQACLHVDPVDPEVDVVLAAEITLAPALVLLRPGLLEPGDRRGRQPGGVLAEQRAQRLLEGAARYAFEVQDRDEHREALGPARVAGQDRRPKANALSPLAAPVAPPRAAHRDRADPGHDLALRQMPVPHHTSPPIGGALIAMALEQCCDFGFDGVRQQRPGPIAQDLRQWIRKTSWLAKPGNVYLGHGGSLPWWRK